jgi:hypothetical protein
MKPCRHTAVVGALLVAGVIVVTGCGGGGGGKRLTKEEFAAKANALCVAFNKQVDTIGNPQTMSEALDAFGKLLPLDRKLVADMEKLRPPADLEQRVKRAVQLGKEQVARAEALIAAVKTGDMVKANQLLYAGNVNTVESKKIFTELGAPDCAK